MSINIKDLPQLQTAALTDSILADTAAAGTGRFRFGDLTKLLNAGNLKMPDSDITIADYYRYFSNPNLFDNPHFYNAVNQKGLTEYVGDGYTIDRWCVNKGMPTNSMKVQYIAGQGVRLTQTAFTQYWDRFIQPCEPTLFLKHVGKKVTCSFYYKDCTANVALQVRNGSTVLNSISVPEGEGVVTITRVVPENFTQAIFGIYLQALNASILLVAAKLEISEEQTLVTQAGDTRILIDPMPNFAVELLKCQRYYYVSSDNMQDFNGADTSHLINKRYLSAGARFPVTMRATPSISIKFISSFFKSDLNFIDGNISAQAATRSGFSCIRDVEERFIEGCYFKYIADSNL